MTKIKGKALSEETIGRFANIKNNDIEASVRTAHSSIAPFLKATQK